MPLWLNNMNQIRNKAYTPSADFSQKDLLKGLSQGFKNKGIKEVI